MTKTFKLGENLIKVEQGYVLVNPQGIEQSEGEVFAIYYDALNRPSIHICKAKRQFNLSCKSTFTSILKSNKENIFYEGHKRFAKIIATINFSLEGVPLVELDEIDKIANLAGDRFPLTSNVGFKGIDFSALRIGFVEGYKAAGGLYTEEELINILSWMVKEIHENGVGPYSSFHHFASDWVKNNPQLILKTKEIKSITLEYIEASWSKQLVEECNHPRELHPLILKINPDNTIKPISWK